MSRSWLTALGLALWLPAAALAQDALSQGRAELDAGRFQEAIAAFDRAASATSGLDRAALIRLLRDRALARGALRDTAGARADLTALFSLDPNADLGSEAPPSLSRLASEVRTAGGSPLSIDVTTAVVEGGREVRTRVGGDRGNLVREIRVVELTADGPRAQVGEVVMITSDSYTVQAIGPGGAILASETAETGETPIIPPVGETSRGGDDVGLFVGLGVGGVVLAGAILAIVLAFVIPGDLTQPSRPFEVFE
jgi:hypothetical protein